MLGEPLLELPGRGDLDPVQVPVHRSVDHDDLLLRGDGPVLALLQDFEQRFADQTAMLGGVWRERVVAMTRMRRFAEARQAAERCLAADPEEAGPVLDQLAEAMGVSPQAVSKWENDISCPDITLLPQLADYFGADRILSASGRTGRTAPRSMAEGALCGQRAEREARSDSRRPTANAATAL